MFLIGTHCLYMGANTVGCLGNYSLGPSSEGCSP